MKNFTEVERATNKAADKIDADLKQNDRGGNVSTSDEGRARDLAADKIDADVSGRTLVSRPTHLMEATFSEFSEEVTRAHA